MSQTILRRRLTRAFVGSVIAGAAFVAGPAAHADPVAGCGADWTLLTIEETVQFIYDASPSVQAQRDSDPTWAPQTFAAFNDWESSLKGSDGYVCVKSTGSTPGQDKQYCGRYGYNPCFAYSVTNINDNDANGRLTA